MIFKMNDQDPNSQEARIGRLLRQLPDRRAPAGLEARVLAEIARRAALPWWRTSFTHWPAAARVSFYGISAIAAALLVDAIFVLGHSPEAHAVTGTVSHSFTWLALVRDVAVMGRDRVLSIVSYIPAVWLYTIGAGLAVSYAALAGLGAATYRAFSNSTPNA